ncbi:MAG: sigma factor-like helix-turn-helix DNA-binding protein [Bacteroidales bacterium]
MENYAIFAPNITRTTLPHNKQNNDFVDPNSNICNTMTDKIIRENFNCGDIKTFEEIYNKNHPKVVSFAYSYLNDIDEANNVNLQENVMPYLFASTKNMCLNLLRKKNYALKYSEHTIREKTNYLNTIALENNSSIKIYESDVENIISRGMTQMKPKVRQTFLMSRVKGLKNREIASAEGVAESTVEARITSALLVMRKLLKDYL